MLLSQWRDQKFPSVPGGGWRGSKAFKCKYWEGVTLWHKPITMPPPRPLVHLEGNPGLLLVWEALSVCGNSIWSFWTWTGFAPYTAASLENSKIKREALSRHEDIQGTSVFQLLCKDWNLVIQQPAGQSQTHRMQQSWPCNEADSLICGHQKERSNTASVRLFNRLVAKVCLWETQLCEQ